MNRNGFFSSLGSLLGIVLVSLLLVPLLAMLVSTSHQDIVAGIAHPMFLPALFLSLKTTSISLALTCLLGTPLAWWLASSRSKSTKIIELVVALPIVIPPAVLGVGLLQTFGREGLLGSLLQNLGLSIPFTASAVIIAQIVVSSPFFIQAATSSFRKVEPDILMVARTLGSSAVSAFFRVALPISLPGIVAGASLAWARSLGEFGATLLFAGNMKDETQTMPLAIFSAMESDLQLAIVFSLVLVGGGGILLAALRCLPLTVALTKRRPR
ncbi:MAG: molybdate ABC transporter permease subunit [Gemmatimonadetes bacterium]|nr:molybdate ABC transporter permease subunit [Gemmatimonadota bacterium]